jgi:glycosyltransferase involved in cell wall biosynthesis
MRVAVFLERLPQSVNNSGGGGFQQTLSMVLSLARAGATDHDVVVFTQYKATREVLLQHGVSAVLFENRRFRIIDIWSGTAFGGAIFRRLRRWLGFRRLGRHLDALLDDHGIDLVLFTEVGEIARRIGDHPFIITVWDSYHRDHPDIREVFTGRLFECLERRYVSILTRAAAVIANSRCGAHRLASLYKVDPRRIVELPFIPQQAVRRHAGGSGRSSVTQVRRTYHLPERYVFYPAYFADDKNHLYLLEGLVDLKRRHCIVLDAVFCGDRQSEGQKRVERQAQAFGLRAQVHFLGWVPDDDIPALYQGALALTMPTFVGPTNVPPLEAVTLGCPVIYADIPEFREQMGDGALYCDLANPSSLADHLAKLIQDPAHRDVLGRAAHRLAAEIATIDYGERLKPVLDRYAYLRRRWGWPERSH